jgi:regulator of Ty1 transposition protein 103
MTGSFSREQLVLKLRDLTESQNSISTLSLWLLHHKKFAADAAKTWFDELKKRKGFGQLLLLYLANDVIQNGKRKGSEYIKHFQHVLVPAMAICGKHGDAKYKPKIQRIIQIWESREVFPVPFILALRQSLTNGEIIKPKLTRAAIEPDKIQERQVELERIQKNRPISPPSTNPISEQPPNKIKRINDSSNESSAVSSMLNILNSSRVDSPDLDFPNSSNSKINYFPPETEIEAKPESESPEPEITAESLTQLVTEVLKDPPSYDSTTRTRITKLPKEVQDPESVKSLHQSGKLEALLNVIEFGEKELKNYNKRLEEEIKQRKILNLNLKLFKNKIINEQKEEENKLQESRARLVELQSTRIKLDKRIQSLPDLSSLNFRKAQPLPEVTDLFS